MTSLHLLPVGSLELIQHTSPDHTDISVDRDHIKALLSTGASIIAISAWAMFALAIPASNVNAERGKTYKK